MTKIIEKKAIEKVLVVCSGGMDSVTLAHKIHADTNKELTAILAFNYGQRHVKEVAYAKACAEKFNVPFQEISIPSLGAMLSSSLTFDGDIPDGHYAEDTMKSTVVPNRNAIMLTMAFGVASSMGVDRVGIAVHGGDHFIYPDCRPEFLESFDAMQKNALEGLCSPTLYAPFVNISKGDIAKVAKDLNLDIVDSWSCYNGNAHHCGRCGTCVERLEAVLFSGVRDSTIYEDSNFYKSVIAG